MIAGATAAQAPVLRLSASYRLKASVWRTAASPNRWVTRQMLMVLMLTRNHSQASHAAKGYGATWRRSNRLERITAVSKPC